VLSLVLALVQAGAAAHAVNVPPFASLLAGVEFFGGAVWAGAFAIASYRLIRQKPNAIRAAGWLVVGFFGYTAARLTWFARADYDRARLPIVWAAVIILTILFWILDLRPALSRRGRHMEKNE